MMAPPAPLPAGPLQASELAALQRIQDRVLWLAVSMIHHANKVRPASGGVKVGGHQASSASSVTLLTALYFHYLRQQDRVSVKPHAAPVLHAINYLAGRLDRRYLTELRAYGGVQSYPSRTKDPDPVDFSTGSVGIGATASIWSALSDCYLSDHFDGFDAGRCVALLGDAELDEGAVWEALVDPMVQHLGNVRWIVDVNRQSLDRVVPDIAMSRLGAMFAAAGWNTITLKFGSRLRELFAMRDGPQLEQRIDSMSNEEYQHLLRLPAPEVRAALAGTGRERVSILRLVDHLDDSEVRSVIRDLAGHDFADVIGSLEHADRVTDRPTVIFAYTIKAWRLPTEGHPGNHSALLSSEQWRALADELGADPDDPWAPFPEGGPEARACETVGRRLSGRPVPGAPVGGIPTDLGLSHRTSESSQQAFGRFLLHLGRTHPEVDSRIVTVSPDVASSTNLGGWINRVGIWSIGNRRDWFAEDRERLVHWSESGHGQHIELGIAETNLVGLLSELGSTWSRHGKALLPIGTLYDTFVTRALEPWSFGIYAGGQSILVGTPSGVTLAPEGGAHQSVITPSIGLEQPGCTAWEPAFAQDLEWLLLSALSSLGRQEGTSSYFRLSTRPVDQGLAAVPDDPTARELRRLDVLAGGYRLREASRSPSVTLVGMGAVMVELSSAALELEAAGVACDVVCLTSADLVFRAFQSREGLASGSSDVLERLFPAERAASIVAVLDGHPHTLAFLGAINASPVMSLGVQDFGQAGAIDDLYRHFGIDAATIVGAAFDLIERGSDKSDI
ncbi:MAG: pyruvate dehydrogenase [Acidimicrobiaceae bacterium]|nr:pyruvate dehydrogenase [Acidimicrobiaceae bacterium]